MPDIDELLSSARDAISVRRVYGDPIEHDGVTLVPAAAVRGGGGGGGDTEGNGGGGFGLIAKPIGAFVIAADGSVSWKPVRNPNRVEHGWQVVAGLAMLALWSLARRRPRSRARPARVRG